MSQTINQRVHETYCTSSSQECPGAGRRGGASSATSHVHRSEQLSAPNPGRQAEHSFAEAQKPRIIVTEHLFTGPALIYNAQKVEKFTEIESKVERSGTDTHPRLPGVSYARSGGLWRFAWPAYAILQKWRLERSKCGVNRYKKRGGDRRNYTINRITKSCDRR